MPKLSVVTILLATTAALPNLVCTLRCPGQTKPSAEASQADGGELGGATVLASLQAPRKSMVLVAVRFNGETHGVPGVVFHRDGDRTLVAARQVAQLHEIYSRGRRVHSGPDYFVLWSEAGQRKSVRAERLSGFARGAIGVLAAPADQLPPPIKIDPAPDLTPQMPVYFFGYETDRTVKPAAFAAFTEKGTLSAVDRDEEGRVKTIEARCSETPALSMAVVATPSGQVIGYCPGRRSRNALGRPLYEVSPSSSLAELLEPQIGFLQFGFESGDTERVVYEFVAFISDPCLRISEPELSIRPQKESEERHPGGPLIPAAEPPTVDSLAGATTLDLQKQPPSEAFRLQYPTVERFDVRRTWVARSPAPNPGLKPKYVFRGQVSYTNKAGRRVYMSPRTLEFSIRHREGGAVPNIPGIDGKPID